MKVKLLRIFILPLLLTGFSLNSTAQEQAKYFIGKSEVTFLSRAPLETIEASSTALKGVIDPATRTFAFSMPMKSFRGFNSELQQEHFHENYLESVKYPVSTFTGKIIDEFDPNVPGRYEIRAKGIFTVRGIPRERILKGIVEVKPGTLLLNVDFTILLDDYSIRIPRLVYQKIAPEIEVNLKAELSQTKG
jgi:hypothetical protein